jgi:hypothetical protein
VSPVRISPALRKEVRERAEGCCEYCLLPEEQAFFPHEPDHIIATKHGGQSTIDNLALALIAIVSKALILPQLILTAANSLRSLIHERKNGASISASPAGLSGLEPPSAA